MFITFSGIVYKTELQAFLSVFLLYIKEKIWPCFLIWNIIIEKIGSGRSQLFYVKKVFLKNLEYSQEKIYYAGVSF